ncbi:MAG TPA: DUF2330 domain-containing protein [Actinomycetota bacterium]|jgi:hypothetical protein|nr:DUF2330 domain-containing protein [Actinomycetota bacterium]
MRRLLIVPFVLVFLTATAGAAFACAGVFSPNGNVNLLRTSTLAGYADGIEHYVTSFTFSGGGGEFGSVVPLPGVPTTVERGGDWTLQRLNREVTPVREVFAAGNLATAARADSAEVLLETTIDALDITILKGGGDEVGTWAKDNGFLLAPDAPEVLDFYADRSPIFMAAKFNAAAAEERGQAIGEGTPIHLSIPTDNPWVPLRILGLGKQEIERVEADVFLLTESEPELIIPSDGLILERSEQGSDSLIADLRSDKGMEWIPEDGMWLSYLRVDSAAGDLTYDLAVDVEGEAPSTVDAGLARVDSPPAVDDSLPIGLLAGVALVVAVLGVGAGRWSLRRAA